MRRLLLLLGLCFAGPVLNVACGDSTPTPTPIPTVTASASGSLIATSSSALTGTFKFTLTGAEVKLEVNVMNVARGPHGVHLHQVGDCSARDASSAGPHWDPLLMNHGKWGTPPHHLGDVGNMDVGVDGTGSYTLTSTAWHLGDGSARDVVGRAVIIHQAADNYAPPAGNAGSRIGCAVIVKDAPAS